MGGRGGIGGRDGGAGGAGGVGRGGMSGEGRASGVENTNDATRTSNEGNATDASGVENPTGATGTGEAGADREREERLEDPKTIMKPTTPSLTKNIQDAEKLIDETANDDGNDTDDSHKEIERRGAGINPEEIQEEDRTQKHKEVATETEKGEEVRRIESGKEEENSKRNVAVKEKGTETGYLGYILDKQIHLLE